MLATVTMKPHSLQPHTQVLMINESFIKCLVYIEVTANYCYLTQYLHTIRIYVTVENFYSKQRAVNSESVFTFHYSIGS